MTNPNNLVSIKLASARVAVFDNAAFVDTRNATTSESDNVQASLTSLGHVVTAFTGTQAADFTAALADADVLLFPEFELGDFLPDTATQDVIRGFVGAGGTLVMNGDAGAGDEAFLNAVFGFSLVQGTNSTFGESAAQPDRAATTFADDPPTLRNGNGTYAVQTASLPTGSLNLYESSGNTTVAAMPFGAGQIVFLAFDWYNAAPRGSQNGGWLEALDSAISRAGEILAVTGTEDGDVLTGTTESENFEALGGNDWLLMVGGSNRVDGGAGRDTVSYADRTGPIVFDQASGVVRVEVYADILSDVEGVTGTGAGDIFRVTDGTMRGLGGEDTFFFRPSGGESDFDGGAGWDKLSFSSTAADTALSLLAGRGFSGAALGLEVTGIEEVRAGAGDDALTGDHGANVLLGLAGDDTLMGNGGNDTLHGGAGVDVAVFSYARDQYNVTTTGFRTVVEYTGAGPGDGIDVADFVEVLRFADGDVLTDTLLGTTGADNLVWLAGITMVDGLAGADRLDFREASLGLRIDGAAGTATQEGGHPVIHFTNVEVVQGSAQADIFVTGAGTDRFDGAAGQDLFIGGGAGDVLMGGASVDTLAYDNSTSDLEVSLLRGRGGAGDAEGLRLSEIENLRGGAGNDRLTGDHGDNFLEGSLGDDTIAGNAGDDLIYAGFGTDVILFSYDQSDYTVTRDGARTTVDYTGIGEGDGTDVILNAEILRFADGDMIL